MCSNQTLNVPIACARCLRAPFCNQPSQAEAKIVQGDYIQAGPRVMGCQEAVLLLKRVFLASCVPTVPARSGSIDEQARRSRLIFAEVLRLEILKPLIQFFRCLFAEHFLTGKNRRVRSQCQGNGIAGP